MKMNVYSLACSRKFPNYYVECLKEFGTLTVTHRQKGTVEHYSYAIDITGKAVEDLVKLSSELGQEIIISTVDENPCIFIYDDYIE